MSHKVRLRGTTPPLKCDVIYRWPLVVVIRNILNRRNNPLIYFCWAKVTLARTSTILIHCGLVGNISNTILSHPNEQTVQFYYISKRKLLVTIAFYSQSVLIGEC